MTLQLQLPGFEGSAAVLVGELEQGKRAIEDVSVSAISAQFQDWLVGRDDPDLLAAGELLRTGARLAALKSTHVLEAPNLEVVEDDEQSPASECDPLPVLVATWLRGRQEVSTYPAPGRVESIPRRVAPRSPLLLLSAIKDMEHRHARQATRVSVPAFMRLEVAVSSLIRRLKSGAAISLSRLLHGATRQDAVVHFLAVLDLVRRRQATVLQADTFGDITVEWLEHAVGAESRAG